MIAHVAEAGEQRGRVVLQLSSADYSPVALEAALRIASAFHSEVESLFVEDQRLFEIAAFQFSREISLCGRRSEALTPERIADQLRYLSASIHRRMALMAAAADVPFKATVVRNDLIAAVQGACERVGPWNVVVLAEPVSPANAERIARLFERVTGATGIMIVGRNAARTSGPILAAVDDIAHLEVALRAAERLAATSEEPQIKLLLIGHDEVETLEMEGQARLLLEARTAIAIQRIHPRYGTVGEVAEALRRASPGFVVARFGGFLAATDADLSQLTAVLDCPLFLIR